MFVRSKKVSSSNRLASRNFASPLASSNDLIKAVGPNEPLHLRIVDRSKVLCLIPMLLLPMAALAQSGGQGSIDGTVKDSSGAVVSTATIKVTNEATGATRTAQTDSRGFFAVESLEPG
jgi:hypothetical protein